MQFDLKVFNVIVLFLRLLFASKFILIFLSINFRKDDSVETLNRIISCEFFCSLFALQNVEIQRKTRIRMMFFAFLASTNLFLFAFFSGHVDNKMCRKANKTNAHLNYSRSTVDIKAENKRRRIDDFFSVFFAV